MATPVIARLGGAAAALIVAAAAAFAQGMPGAGDAGRGVGGPSYRFGPNNTPGWSMMTEQERTEHHDRMHAFKSYDECKAYMDDFARRMQQRAKDTNRTMPDHSERACDRMREQGFFR